jgi:hypothetical protein
MPTKFVVLWSQANTNGDFEILGLFSNNFSSLEDAWRFYNELCAKDENQQVMILVPLKDFNRSSK